MIANPNSTTWTLRRPNQLAAYAATTVVVPTRHPSTIAPHGGAGRSAAPRSAWRGGPPPLAPHGGAVRRPSRRMAGRRKMAVAQNRRRNNKIMRATRAGEPLRNQATRYPTRQCPTIARNATHRHKHEPAPTVHSWPPRQNGVHEPGQARQRGLGGWVGGLGVPMGVRAGVRVGKRL